MLLCAEVAPVEAQNPQVEQQSESTSRTTDDAPIETSNKFAELNKEDNSPPNECIPSSSQEEHVSTSFSNTFVLNEPVSSKRKKKKKKKKINKHPFMSGSAK
ncbi:unnamed protein product [Ilex paraguariensis]|uniref:Uncharacterized protein n=1 Tax=Ilex paraguariensis TaxID=185542 RepID=A0ABC8SZ10_9AQUA